MKKYLEFYNRCRQKDYCPFLCHHFDNDPLFKLFIPNKSEIKEHVIDGYLDYAWGCKEGEDGNSFTPLRQNIVLFMAAINGEL